MTAMSGHTARSGLHGSAAGSMPVTDCERGADEAARKGEVQVGADAVSPAGARRTQHVGKALREPPLDATRGDGDDLRLERIVQRRAEYGGEGVDQTIGPLGSVDDQHHVFDDISPLRSPNIEMLLSIVARSPWVVHRALLGEERTPDRPSPASDHADRSVDLGRPEAQCVEYLRGRVDGAPPSPVRRGRSWPVLKPSVVGSVRSDRANAARGVTRARPSIARPLAVRTMNRRSVSSIT